MINHLSIETSETILTTIPKENQDFFLFYLDTLPSTQAEIIAASLEKLGIIIAYDWMPFHRDKWFFPTLTDYEDLLDYYYEMTEQEVRQMRKALTPRIKKELEHQLNLWNNVVSSLGEEDAELDKRYHHYITGFVTALGIMNILVVYKNNKWIVADEAKINKEHRYLEITEEQEKKCA